MMKRHLIEFVALVAMTLAPVVLQAQTPAKIYTRKVLLADFPTSVTKVVMSSQSLFEMALREEIVSRWNSSPYEFCSVEDYEKLKTDSKLYFLRLVHEDGIIFMVLSKGGVEGEKDMTKTPFEVVRVPAGAYGDPMCQEACFLGAFVDIIQRFVKDGMNSDITAYSGLSRYDGGDVKGKTVVLDRDKAVAAMENGDPDTLAGVVVAPLEITFDTWCYKMLFDTVTHELYAYSKVRYKDKSDSAFTAKEAARFQKHGAKLD